MFALTFIGDIIVFIAGGALIWFCKDPIQKFFLGAESFATKLRDKANAVATAAKKS